PGYDAGSADRDRLIADAAQTVLVDDVATRLGNVELRGLVLDELVAADAKGFRNRRVGELRLGERDERPAFVRDVAGDSDVDVGVHARGFQPQTLALVIGAFRRLHAFAGLLVSLVLGGDGDGVLGGREDEVARVDFRDADLVHREAVHHVLAVAFDAGARSV